MVNMGVEYATKRNFFHDKLDWKKHKKLLNRETGQSKCWSKTTVSGQSDDQHERTA
jgi:hypothetical protein